MRHHSFDLKFTRKEFLSLFLILLVPSLLRHVSYFMAFTQTGIYPSVSPESVAAFKGGKVVLFFLEEIGLSLFMCIVYFFRHELHFLTLGYLVDPVIDVFNSLGAELFGRIPLTNFVIRELALPYLLIGFLLMFFFDEYKKVKNYVYAIILMVLALQLVF